MPKTQRLGEILVTAGLVTEEALTAAVEHQRALGPMHQGRMRLGLLLVDMGVISEEALAHALSLQLGIPYIDLNTATPDPSLLDLVPRRLAEHHSLVPVERTNDGILVAMSDPSDIIAIDDVRVSAKAGPVRPAVAPASAVRDAIGRFYSLDSQAANVVHRLGVAAEVEVVADHDEVPDEALVRSAHDAPIVKLANAIFADAVRARSTDIHIEPRQTDVRVRYRVDGLLREIMTLPKTVHASLVSRIKIVSGMDIAERRRPQDGRSRIVIDGVEVSVRVSTIPTMRGEKVVVRLLRQGDETVRLGSAGLDDEQMGFLEEVLHMPQGFVLFTGPTGSGKTTTMYASLEALRSPELNVVTLEDPIEYQLPGISQVQIDERTGVTFAKGLRSILRQDPNVIMVGEIRDAETAKIAMQAAMTGHLVFSTVHTNDAASAITRLIDIGVEPFLIASALSAVVAQRLVRVVCAECAEPATASEATVRRLGLAPGSFAGAELRRGAGCDACGFTGFRGRTGLFEVMPVTRQIREHINAARPDAVITAAARAAGVRSLLDNGVEKVRAGITTLEEVLRAVQVEQRHERPVCPACRQEIDSSFVVCPFCQHELGGQACPGCAKHVASDWAVCPYCRTDLPQRTPEGTGRPRLLVADDDEGIRMLIRTVFRDEFEVSAAAGGEEALRRAAIERPDAILLDLHMPDLSGIEVAKRLRASASTSLIPLIMLTGDQSGEIDGLRAGVDDYVMKPFNEPVLRARIASVIRASQRA